MKEKEAETLFRATSSIFIHKGGSKAIFSDNGKEYKNAVLNDAC